MKLRLNLTFVLAVAALGLVGYQMVQHHLSPLYLIILVVLFGGRFYVRKQIRTREQILKDVPRHPLGLSEDD